MCFRVQQNRKKQEQNNKHCVKNAVSWSGNPMIRTRILREYWKIREYRVPRHATCQDPYFPDSDFFRGKENPVSRHVIETWRVKAGKFAYFSRFAENSGVPCTSWHTVHFFALLSSKARQLVFAFHNKFISLVLNSTVRDVYVGNGVPDIPRYGKCHLEPGTRNSTIR